MIFTSFAFLLFFALVYAAYWRVAAGEWRARLLLAASALFYGWWDWRFLALIGATIGVAYLCGRAAAPGPDGAVSAKAKRAMWLGVILLLGLLGVFKYFNFFIESADALLVSLGAAPSGVALRILLPVGVSFYVFQAISYVVDVRRGDAVPERRLSRVALYVAFFPQLVAGPIVRAARFLPQVDRAKRWRLNRQAAAARAFALGFIYKALIADNLAGLADPVFADVAAFSNLALIGATLVFAVQLYFDFAGYSLMAIGVARAFDYRLPLNFLQPFTAASVTEYWRRWHISLSTFLRDYLYRPLGGHDGPRWFYYRNLMITMFLGGIWHGAAWTFILWGTLQGVALIVHKLWRQHVERPMQLTRRVPTGLYWLFGLVLTQAFIVQQRGLFRAEDITDGLAVFGAFAGLRDGGAGVISALAWTAPVFVLADALIARRRRIGLSLPQWDHHPRVYWGLVGAMIALALAVYPLDAAPFVYFQF